MHNLRNAVAHFRFTPRHKNRRVIGFNFSDLDGFEATLDAAEMRVFVEKMAEHLARTAGQAA